MKSKRILIGLVTMLAVLLSISVFAQVNRPFKNGTVWNIAMIRMKPGMETSYLNYVSGQWKKEQDALKAQNLILSYKVLRSDGHTPNEWNLLLMTEYKDMASMEANENKADDLAQKVIGNDEVQRQGYKERAEIREVLGSRLAREIVLK